MENGVLKLALIDSFFRARHWLKTATINIYILRH
jgi:hypothetical protein